MDREMRSNGMVGLTPGPDLPGLLAGPSAARCWPQKRAALDAASELYLFVAVQLLQLLQ